MDRVCQSCGAEMKKPVDFAAGDTTRTYCRHCVDDFDELKSYEEVFSDQVGFLMKTENLSQEEAEERVKERLATIPAWRGRT
ncbi:hypothetical protein HY478_03425 [Candidatus Uhrbacteria bacterium]|nr:hypothetical protein [Candidatus Uhrbacteria bacterium]